MDKDETTDSTTAAPLFEPLLTAEQAAAFLKIHPKTLKHMAAEGAIPGMHIGKVWRFRCSALDEWINHQLESESRSRPQRRIQ